MNTLTKQPTVETLVSEKETGMNCNSETGVCEVTVGSGERPPLERKKAVKLLYFTDPICSSCWGIEPQLRKLKSEYGDYFNLDYRMGGLLKSWNEYGDKDVNGPQSVAKHWEEAGAYYEMPIDGDVWIADPLHSSYPPAIAFKAAQMQDEKKALWFLRKVKEMVFVEGKNITRVEHLLQAAGDVGLDVSRFENDYHTTAPLAFEEELATAKAWGVRGFPTIYFMDEEGNRLKVYGSKPYHTYEGTLLQLLPGEVEKNRPTSYKAIFEEFDTVSLKEFALFYDKTLAEAETILNALEKENKVKRTAWKAGPLWKAVL